MAHPLHGSPNDRMLHRHEPDAHPSRAAGSPGRPTSATSRRAIPNWSSKCQDWSRVDDPAGLGAPGALGQGLVAGSEGGSVADPAPLVPVALPFGGPAIQRLWILPCERSGCLSGVSRTRTRVSGLSNASHPMNAVPTIRGGGHYIRPIQADRPGGGLVGFSPTSTSRPPSSRQTKPAATHRDGSRPQGHRTVFLPFSSTLVVSVPSKLPPAEPEPNGRMRPEASRAITPRCPSAASQAFPQHAAARIPPRVAPTRMGRLAHSSAPEPLRVAPLRPAPARCEWCQCDGHAPCKR